MISPGTLIKISPNATRFMSKLWSFPFGGEDVRDMGIFTIGIVLAIEVFDVYTDVLVFDSISRCVGYISVSYIREL